MKTLRTTLGIISIVLFAFISFQSCAAGLGNALENNGSNSGAAGFLLSLCMLIAGIIAIVGRESKIATIIAGCVYLVGAIIGASDIGIFKDLQIWAVISAGWGIVFLISGILQKKKINNSESSSTN